jgi:hypothetical protein
MVDYIESKVGKEGKILIEVEDAKGHVGFGATETTKEETRIDDAFNQALRTIRLAAGSVLETLNTLEQKPDQVKIDFAIKIEPSVGAMLSKLDSRDAQLKLGWQTTPPEENKA